MVEIPFEQERVRTAETRNGTIEVPVLRLWGEDGPHLYLIPKATTDGCRHRRMQTGPIIRHRRDPRRWLTEGAHSRSAQKTQDSLVNRVSPWSETSPMFEVPRW